MNPDRHASSHYDYFRDLIKGDESSAETHRKFYDEYNAVLDMDADYYLETIKTVFQDFSLPNGTWDVRSPKGKLERVRPQDIKTTALLTIEGELDDISGSGQTEAAHDLCTHVERGEQHHMEVKGAGHYGIFSGRRWRTVVYPHVRDFIAQHTTAQIHGGITALIAITGLFAASAWVAWRRYRDHQDPFAGALLVCVFVASQFDRFNLVSNAGWQWLTFWFPFAILAAYELRLRDPGTRAAGGERRND